MKGVYVLVISINKDISVNIGALGNVHFERGLYAYVGSAQNSLEKRVERHHRKKGKRRFWHIDYLLANDAVRIVKVLCKEAARSEECEIAEKTSMKGTSVTGFGSSDCRCESHLFRIEDYGFLREYIHELST